MMVNKSKVISDLCPPLDGKLVELLVDEFVSQEKRYVLGDWEPAELDGGQFAEIASRIIYHVDSGNLNLRKGVDGCLKYIENDSNSHCFPNRRSSLHLCRIIRAIYKFRSQRGAVHIDPDYMANELDSTLIIENVRWVMSEILRIFWNGDRTEVSRIIKEILRYDLPAVFEIEDRRLLLRTDCSVEEEILILLYNSGEQGLSRKKLGEAIPKAASSVTNSLRKLCSARKREIAKRGGGFIITPLGTKRIHEDLAEKLTL